MNCYTKQNNKQKMPKYFSINDDYSDSSETDEDIKTEVKNENIISHKWNLGVLFQYVISDFSK